MCSSTGTLFLRLAGVIHAGQVLSITESASNRALCRHIEKNLAPARDFQTIDVAAEVRAGRAGAVRLDFP